MIHTPGVSSISRWWSRWFREDIFLIFNDLVHHHDVARREPYSLHDPARVIWVGYVYTGPAQHLTTAGEDLADVDRDLSDLSEMI